MKEVRGLAGQTSVAIYFAAAEQSGASLTIIELATFQNTVKWYKNTGKLLPLLYTKHMSIHSANFDFYATAETLCPYTTVAKA